MTASNYTYNGVDAAGIQGRDDASYSFGDIGTRGNYPLSGDFVRGIIHFDFTLPASAVVTAAFLKLYLNSNPRPYADSTFSIYRVTESWIYNQVTRSHRTSTDLWTTQFDATILAAKLLSASASTGQYYQWDFNSDGLAAIDAIRSGTYANNGFMCKLQDENDNVLHNFAGTGSGNPPVLGISYTVAGINQCISFF